LSEKYHVFAFDMLGFGLSDKPIITYSSELWRDQALDFIEKVIKSVNNKACVIAGNSLGGFTRDAECLWHTHESGCHYFHHLNVLYGAKGMLNTSTGFVQAADWYEKQSESFKSELDA
jgi:hypothetical protein